MSDQEDDELELQALQRRLDDAFQTTRPRAGFDDELWARVQSARPAQHRLRDALAASWRRLTETPALPAAATALVLIVAIGAGIIALNEFGPRGGGASSAGTSEIRLAPISQQATADSFGRLPSPVFSGPVSISPAPVPVQGGSATSSNLYSGPVQYTWTGTFALNITTAPVFRYNEPTTAEADQFASELGAVLRERPSGFLGRYASADYTLEVRGTIRSPQSSPAYFIFSGLNLPAVDTAGGPQDVADIFLAQHGLTPQWPYTASVDTTVDPVKVTYERQFAVAGYGDAYLLDFNGNRYGMEVDLQGNRPVLAGGMLPLSFDVANYNVLSADDAIRTVLGPPDASRSQLPAVQLNHAELVYVLVPAGDHSFYEPAFLFTGTLHAGSQSYTRRVLISAVDPSQRTR